MSPPEPSIMHPRPRNNSLRRTASLLSSNVLLEDEPMPKRAPLENIKTAPRTHQNDFDIAATSAMSTTPPPVPSLPSSSSQLMQVRFNALAHPSFNLLRLSPFQLRSIYKTYRKLITINLPLIV